MSFRDRFLTPQTARALLSWRIAIGVGVAVAMGVAGIAWPVAVVIGVGVYGALVVAAMPRGERRAAIDPFTLSEPWRRFVQNAQRAQRQLGETLARTDAGPLADRLADIAQRLDDAIVESWRVAQRGDTIDDTIRQLDPTRLRSDLTVLEGQRDTSAPSADELTAPSGVDTAIESLQSQLATSERLKSLSDQTVDRLRTTNARIDELVARAAEVSVGSKPVDDYSHDVDSLVIEMQAMSAAIADVEAAGA